jgi:hypothetical protein
MHYLGNHTEKVKRYINFNLKTGFDSGPHTFIISDTIPYNIFLRLENEMLEIP